MKAYLILSLCLILVSCEITENMKKCWDYFITHGITKAGAAGLLGNLQAESGVRPNILEKSKVSKVGMNSEEYIRRTNDGTYKNFGNDRAGFGLVQWTYPSRKQNLYNHCRGKIEDLYCQLEFLLIEIKTYKTVYSTITTSNSVAECSRIIMTRYEKPANLQESNISKRASMSQRFYDALAGSSVTYKEEPQQPQQPEQPQPQDPEEPEQPSTGRTYTVVKGDTLTRIAKRYNTTVKRLCELNNIKNANLIRIGQVLKID
jgi:LysM repeat protein